MAGVKWQIILNDISFPFQKNVFAQHFPKNVRQVQRVLIEINGFQAVI